MLNCVELATGRLLFSVGADACIGPPGHANICRGEHCSPAERRCEYDAAYPIGHGRHTTPAGPGAGVPGCDGAGPYPAAGLRRGHPGQPAEIRRELLPHRCRTADPLPRRPHFGPAGPAANTGQPEPHRTADDLRPAGTGEYCGGHHGLSRAAALPCRVEDRRGHMQRSRPDGHAVPPQAPRALLRLPAAPAPGRAVRRRTGQGRGYPAGILAGCRLGRASAALRRATY